MKAARGGRQATLFEAWGARPDPGEEDGEDDEDEALLLAAAEEAEARPGGFVAGPAGRLWLFPGGPGLETRPYQVRAVRAALLGNTLLCLPTGLGKTLVAAAVLHNFSRWFPAGKALFLAPTRPLVAQQRRACARLMGLPARDAAQVTGGTSIADRKELWRHKKVFFLTPQILVNDLSRGICPAAEVKCLVLDEAHRALGNYAYCQVVKELCKYTHEFRILALTATPGSDAKAVQQVVSNLLISHIELCTEDSPDIQPYSHERRVEKTVVPLGKELAGVQAAYIRVLEAFAGRLTSLRALSQRDISSLTKYQIILARDQFRKNPASHFTGKQQGAIEGDFALCISLYHGYELLLQMGMRSLYIFLTGIMDGSKGMTRARNELGRNEDFVTLYSQLESMFADTSAPAANGSNEVPETGSKKPFVYGHPKLKKLEEVVTEHFQSWNENAGQTRVMIFSSFRDSVQEIAEMLSRHHPLLRVMTFVGHSVGRGKGSGSGGSSRGFTQKEQLEVVKRFREGGYNTLVSTCVGEEGLDIGEVDLIVCFDAQKSPIRLVQRMGRTGRKRQGRIVVILSEGREERTYNQSQSNRKSLLKALAENKGLRLYQHSPRMIPEGIDPQMHLVVIAPKEEEEEEEEEAENTKGDTLLQPWLPFSAGTGGKQPRPSEGWGLSPEEFERWRRLYKLEPGDGIKMPALPRSRFETFPDEETESVPVAEEVRVLSLTEWSLWQSRPFPTVLVDHSGRCQHFIGLMDMIEQMRHEEGDCSYEKEIRPYLHWEDVHISGVQKKKSGCDTAIAQKTSKSRRTALDASKRSSSSFAEMDTEWAALFKPNSVKAASRAHVRTAAPSTRASEGIGSSDTFLANNSEDPRWAEKDGESMGQNDKTNALQRGTSHCGSEGSRGFQSHPEEAEERIPENGHSVDSGCGRLAEESSPASSLFYLPESETDLFAGTDAGEGPLCGEDILRAVAKLLSRSPPSLKEIFDSEERRNDEERQRGSGQKSGSSLSLGPLPSENPVPLKNPPSAPDSISGHSDVHALGPLNFHLETNLASSPSVGKTSALDWDELFDNSSEEEIGVLEGNLPVTKHCLKMGKDGDEEPQGSCTKSGRNMTPDQAVTHSVEEECLSENAHSPIGKGKRPLVISDLCSQPNSQAIGTLEWPSCDDHVQVTHQEPADSLVLYGEETLEPAGDVCTAKEGKPELHEGLFDASQELFSVNFDLGFSIQESEEEEARDGRDATPGFLGADISPLGNVARKSPPTSSEGCFGRTKSSTPLHPPDPRSALPPIESVIPVTSPLTPAGLKQHPSFHAAQPEFSTPRRRPEGPLKGTLGGLPSRKRERSPPGAVPSQAQSSLVKVLAKSAFPGEKAKGKAEKESLKGSIVLLPAQGPGTDSEEDIVFLRKNKKKRTILTSPNNNSGDVESPIHTIKKRRRPLIASDLSSDENTDFTEKPNQVPRDVNSGSKRPVPGAKREKRRKGRAGLQEAARCFIEEEAALSEEGSAGVSSDESLTSEDAMSSSIAQFLNDETQDLNESEMQGVYLESVRSPAVGNRYKMVMRKGGHHALTVFSQVPEQDESYLADSFCVEDNVEDNSGVGSCEEEEEEVHINFDLLEEESFANGRKLYCTRRRKKLKCMEEAKGAPSLPRRPSRVRILEDSSEDEGEVGREEKGSHATPSLEPHRTLSPRPPESRAHRLLKLKASLSEELDFLPLRKSHGQKESMAGDLRDPTKVERPSGASFSSALAACPSSSSLKDPAALCILADSREISSGPEVISTLKAAHGVKVQVCSLGVCDYVVSHRMAVERKSPAELLHPAQRSRAALKVQEIRRKFDRICVIVEKERPKSGEACRAFRRTQHYDGILSALVRAGVRLLFSSGQEETAGLLKELALVEQRKEVGIAWPAVEVTPRQEGALRFYLSIPCVGHPLALALCHAFRSIREAANSSPSEMAARTQVSQQKAEEVFQYLRHPFDAQMLPNGSL
ncbi:Fanconi anemia group M protein isoform X2 [Anolis carolinensis]|uniref:Fanconi anemia group M protein isoform X2 n=1 Tax=Anolis carolinensis TaxID=28377 RepID=UPI002F2B7EE3